MSKCAICRKGLRLLEGHSEYGKIYCSDCFPKRNTVSSKKVTRQDNKTKISEIKANYWILIGIVGLILLLLIFLPNIVELFGSQEYKDCVDNCVYENSNCINSIDPLMDKYLEEYLDILEVESCMNDLESCITYCE